MATMTTTTEAGPTVGQLLRTWRQRRRLSQLELAGTSRVSARHLSFVETGRARPTREMILHLSEHLEVPLRRRNEMLLAGGFAPVYPEHHLAEPPMSAVSDAVTQILDAHHPYPAVVVDSHWELVAANTATNLLLQGSAPHLLEPPVNVLRLSLHPDGMAARILNLEQWRAHLLARLDRQARATGDPALHGLHEELRALPVRDSSDSTSPQDPYPLVVPLRCRVGEHELSLFSMTTVFGTPLDVTVSELAIETFYPSDAATAATLHQLNG